MELVEGCGALPVVRMVVALGVMKVDVVELDVVELVHVELVVQVVRYANPRNPLHPAFGELRNGLCSSPAGQAVEFDSRSTHPQTLPDPPDGVTMVGKLDMFGVVVHVLVGQMGDCE